MMRVQKLVVSKLPSLNTYAHYRRARSSRVIKDSIGWAIKEQRIRPVMDYPIAVEVVGYFVRRTYDTTNMAGPWKLIEDELVEMGILIGDSRQYVGPVLLQTPQDSPVNYDFVECYLIEGGGGFSVRALAT